MTLQIEVSNALKLESFEIVCSCRCGQWHQFMFSAFDRVLRARAPDAVPEMSEEEDPWSQALQEHYEAAV